MATGIIQSDSTTYSQNGIRSIKYADGTLIQFGYQIPLTASGSLSQIASSSIYTGVFELTFPVAFVNTNYVVTGSSRYGTGHAVPFGQTGATSTTKAELRVYDFYARSMSDGTYKFTFTAIGRWK